MESACSQQGLVSSLMALKKYAQGAARASSMPQLGEGEARGDGSEGVYARPLCVSESTWVGHGK